MDWIAIIMISDKGKHHKILAFYKDIGKQIEKDLVRASLQAILKPVVTLLATFAEPRLPSEAWHFGEDLSCPYICGSYESG